MQDKSLDSERKRYLEQAAKELAIRASRPASYLERLEDAFLKAYASDVSRLPTAEEVLIDRINDQEDRLQKLETWQARPRQSHASGFVNAID